MRIITEKRKSRQKNDSIDNDIQESNESIDSYDSVNESQELSSFEEPIDESIDLSEDIISDIEEIIFINQITDESFKSYQTVSMDLSQPVPRPVHNRDHSFSQSEEHKLTELFRVFNHMEFNLKGNYNMIEGKNIQEVLRHSALNYEYDGNRFIKNINRLSSFQTINNNDKLAMVKYGGIEVLLLRCVYYYNKQDECSIIPIVINC